MSDKVIYCIDLELTFNSLNEAKDYFGAPSKDHIGRVCRGERRSYRGHTFKYLEDETITSIPVVIMETGKEFDSLDSCAATLKVTKADIRGVCETQGHAVNGCHVCYKKDYNKDNNPWFGKPISQSFAGCIKAPNKGNPVIIMETEQAFNTVQDCADFLGCSRVTLSDHLRGVLKSCCGYHVCHKKDYSRDDNPYFKEK